MFAGPNGSGKSTLVQILKPEWLGYFINPDEIQKQILLTGYFDFSSVAIALKNNEPIEYTFMGQKSRL